MGHSNADLGHEGHTKRKSVEKGGEQGTPSAAPYRQRERGGEVDRAGSHTHTHTHTHTQSGGSVQRVTVSVA
jgi:hypothetical protein